MNTGKRNTARKVLCLVLAVLILGSLVSGALIMTVGAASSKGEKELVALREEQAELKKQSDALQSSINENQAKTQTLVEKKADIDQQMEISRQTIENLNEQIQQYSFSLRRSRTNSSRQRRRSAAQQAHYKTRLRAMEETGKISYWSILFGASSFSDLLDKVNDQRNCRVRQADAAEDGRGCSTDCLRARRSRNPDGRAGEGKNDLAEQQTALETQRAESDQLILQMSAEYDSLSEEYQNYEKLEDEMSAQIKKTETEYFNALSKEEAARQAETEPAEQQQGSVERQLQFRFVFFHGRLLYPLPYAVPITDAYGYRIHPLSGTYKWHNGVDLAAGSGTAIYATKSGTVTSACYNEAYGYMVTINHADGYSSLYGHMTNYIVSAGDYVTQGQTIGYVGSTGWSTGPHLHFTIYYNGADVNPMNYVSMP